MQQLIVDLGPRSYPIVIGQGLLADGELLARVLPHQALLVVTNETLARLHLDALLRGLAGRSVAVHHLPDGEQFKNLDTVATIFDALTRARLNRDSAIVALGGGVVGDIAGFAAACYQRGINYLQVPTTLLAQVDSAVGGKTGVNLAAGKNLIGAFHQPCGVIADIGTLGTLPDREYRSGLAEVVKYGLIRDAQFFHWLELNLEDLLARRGPALEHAIRRSCEIKAELVSGDEREQGARALLNLGHTFAHAIESATGYGEWLHGEAVAVGLLMATSLSARLGRMGTADVNRIHQLLARTNLPASAPAIGAARALDFMHMDKKVRAGQLRLVLLTKLGQAQVTSEYDAAQLRATLTEFFGP